MSSNPAPAETESSAPAGRSRTVQYALYAILARCVFAIGAAFALYGARGEVAANNARVHPDWSADKLHTTVDQTLRSNLIASIGSVLVVLLIAKFIRDGRNWARWLFAVISFLVTGDVLGVTGFFRGHNVGFRLLTGLTGLAAIAAIFFLFLRSSSAYFRPAGAVSVSPLRALLGGRGALANARAATGAGPTVSGRTPGVPAVIQPGVPPPVETRPADPADPAAPAGSRPRTRRAMSPRAKSRRPNAE